MQSRPVPESEGNLSRSYHAPPDAVSADSNNMRSQGAVSPCSYHVNEMNNGAFTVGQVLTNQPAAANPHTPASSSGSIIKSEDLSFMLPYRVKERQTQQENTGSEDELLNKAINLRKEEPEENNILQTGQQVWNDFTPTLRQRLKETLQKRDQAWNRILQRKEQEWNGILQKKDEELDYCRKNWKQASSELNRVLAQTQGFYQVTDHELIQKTSQSRFNVRNFADQHFGEVHMDAKNFGSSCKLIEKYIEISHDLLVTCIEDPSNHPTIARAFLWAVFRRNIFGCFCWAGTRVSQAMVSLKDLLGDKLSSGIEAKRKFQIWRTNTNDLIRNALETNQQDDHDVQRKSIRYTVYGVFDVLSPFSKCRDKDLIGYLYHLFDEALDLDKLISSQVAEVTWVSDISKNAGKFNQDLMEPEPGKEQMGDSGNVMLVSAPGMIKRGKSTGEDFHVENMLLKMEVCWEPKKSQGQKLPPRLLSFYNGKRPASAS